VSPTVSGVYRTLIGGVVLLVIIFLRRESFWKGGFFFLIAVLLGFIFALDIYFWHKSIHFVGPGLATILANFQVFLLALFGVFVLGERLSTRTTLAIPMAFLGLPPPPAMLPTFSFYENCRPLKKRRLQWPIWRSSL
jgi:drug/metabolite transporter (DMT)-like permease